MATNNPRRGSITELLNEINRPFEFDALAGKDIPSFSVSEHISDFDKNTIYVDLETTGLRTKSYNVLDTAASKSAPGITEIATFYREAGETTAKPVGNLTGYTDVIPKDVLEGIGDDVPAYLTTAPHHGPGSRIDEAVLQEGKLKNIFMDYVHAAKEGKYSNTDIDAKFGKVGDYLSDFTKLMEDAAAGKGGILTGWNISFDVNMMIDTATEYDKNNGTDYSSRMNTLMKTNKIKVKDLDEPLKRYIFNQAMTGEAVPENLSRKKINEALQDGTSRQSIVGDVEKHGIEGHKSKYVDEHLPLKRLGEDVREHGTDREVFKRRLAKGLQEQRPMLAVEAVDNAAIEKVANELTRVADAIPEGDVYDAYRTAQQNLRDMIRSGTAEEATRISLMIKGAYGDGHKSLLGEVNHINSRLPWNVLDDLTSSLNYVGGRTQDIIADILQHPMAESAHVAMADIPMGSELSSRLEATVEAAKTNDSAKKHMSEIIEESKRRRFAEQTSEIVKEAPRPSHVASRVTAEAVDLVEPSKFQKAITAMGGWKGAVAVAAAGYLAYDLFTDDPHVEGVRRSTSQYDNNHGIALGQSQALTPYGSGRDTKYQMLQAVGGPQKDHMRDIHRKALSKGREALHARVSPETYDMAQKRSTMELRGMVERHAGNRFSKRTILPAPPPPRPDQTLSYYDMDGQTKFSQNVQSNSHSSVAEHPDHDHRRQGLNVSKIVPERSGMSNMSKSTPPPRVKPEMPQNASEGLSAAHNRSTMSSDRKPIDIRPPVVAMPSHHTGNSKVRDQGAKNFASPPPVNKPTTNKTRHIRGNE